MTLGNLVKGAIIAGLISAGSNEAPDREKSGHEQAYALNAQELTIDHAELDRLDAIAANGSLDLEQAIEAVAVNEDGTGTYRLSGPIGYIMSASLDEQTKNHEPIKDSFDETTTLYHGSGSAEYVTPVTGIGANPLDAIVDLVSNASEAAYVKDARELTESYETVNGEAIDETSFTQDIDAVTYAGGVDPGTITVEELRSGDMLLGYLASTPSAQIYGSD